jgi:hypothetical protein
MEEDVKGNIEGDVEGSTEEDVEGEQARHKRQRVSGEFTRQDYQVCGTCEEAYDPEETSEDECAWHDGMCAYVQYHLVFKY